MRAVRGTPTPSTCRSRTTRAVLLQRVPTTRLPRSRRTVLREHRSGTRSSLARTVSGQVYCLRASLGLPPSLRSVATGRPVVTSRSGPAWGDGSRSADGASPWTGPESGCRVAGVCSLQRVRGTVGPVPSAAHVQPDHPASRQPSGRRHLRRPAPGTSRGVLHAQSTPRTSQGYGRVEVARERPSGRTLRVQPLRVTPPGVVDRGEGLPAITGGPSCCPA